MKTERRSEIGKLKLNFHQQTVDISLLLLFSQMDKRRGGVEAKRGPNRRERNYSETSIQQKKLRTQEGQSRIGSGMGTETEIEDAWALESLRYF